MPARQVIARYAAALTAAIVFILIVWGGIVHNTGSSLACPDWPLCYGQIVVDTSALTPAEARGVFWEHTHRYLGTLAGLLSILLVALLWRRLPDGRSLRGRAWMLLVLMIVQGVIGGVTVLLRLPTLVSTAHLALSLIVLGLIVNMVHALRTPAKTNLPDEALARFGALKASIATVILVVYIQTVLGALVRHTGSSIAAGVGWPGALIGSDPNTMSYSLWPSFPPAQINVLHRYAGLLVLFLTIMLMWRVVKTWREWPTQRRHWLAFVSVSFVVLQIVVGVVMLLVWMVDYRGIDWRIVLRTLHLAIPALLLAVLYWLMLDTPAAAPAKAAEV